jgi:cytochrome c2
MKKQLFLSVILVTLLVALSTVPALAGGWATITVDALPARISAGETLTIGFMVRQHGYRPMEDLQPTLTFSGAGEKDNFAVEAYADGEVGHYAASVTFPNAGTWNWAIQAFTMDQPMPSLTVGEASAVQSAPGRPIPVGWVLAGAGGLTCLAGSGWAFSRKRPRLGLALAILGLAIAGAGFVFSPGQSAQSASANAAEAGNYSPNSEEANNDSPAETGRALFVSKGCVTCHLNRHIEAAYFVFSTEIGPDLTNFTAAPEYLRMWLSDPAAVKPDTKMPDLGLNEAEIEALIAFLNVEAKK